MQRFGANVVIPQQHKYLMFVDDGIELCVELVQHGDDLEGAGVR